jgi:hypothetical protein
LDAPARVKRMVYPAGFRWSVLRRFVTGGFVTRFQVLFFAMCPRRVSRPADASTSGH